MDDLLDRLSELSQLGVQVVQRLRGRDRPQSRNQLVLNQILHFSQVVGDLAQRRCGLFDRLLLLLNADVEDGLDFGAETIVGDQRVCPGPLHHQFEGAQRHPHDVVDDGDYQCPAIDHALAPAHTRADERLVGARLDVEAGDYDQDAEQTREYCTADRQHELGRLRQGLDEPRRHRKADPDDQACDAKDRETAVFGTHVS